MRSRHAHSHNEVAARGEDNEVTLPSASSVDSAAPLLGHHRDRPLNVKDAALCDEYALRLRKQAEDNEWRRSPFWRMRCSPSILVGLLIWIIVGVVVYTQVQNGLGSEEAAPANASALITIDTALPEGCRGDFCLEEGGTEPFGAVLGAHNGVYAYSNCYAHSCVSFLDFEYPIPLPPGSHTALDDPKATTRLMRTGMRWQCVEYARRYWMLRGTPAPAVFGSVDGAADMWDQLDYVTLLDNVTTAPLYKYANGAALGYGGSAPRVGDLMIYPRDGEGKFPFGHVAVIVGVQLPDAWEDGMPAEPRQGRVFIAEQNWHSNPWPGPFHNASRTLPLWVTPSTQESPRRYTIHDDYHTIQGWMRYGDA